MSINSFSKTLTLLIVLAFTLFIGCSDDDNGTGSTTGFVANESDFAGYSGWNLEDFTIFPVNSSILGEAHLGNNPEYVRAIFSETDLSSASGSWAEGTIVIKETFKWAADGSKMYAESGGLLAMVKRGGGFNPDHAGWEWFMLDPADGSILDRGDDLLDGACNSCHAVADNYGGTDYVFKHPSEYIIDDADVIDFFSDGNTWDQIQYSNGPDPLLGAAHGITDSLWRGVYRYQPGMNTYMGEFPIGSVVFKEVTDDMGNWPTPAAGAWTAMVKRGGNFNSAAGDWDWFMLDPAAMTIADRGAIALCIGCHGAASNDYVFSYPWP